MREHDDVPVYFLRFTLISLRALLEKLFTSIVTSVIIYFGPIIGLNFQKMGSDMSTLSSQS